MQYYTFELDEESTELCAIITPFGKYNHKYLPMGFKCTHNAQQIMKQVFSSLEDIGVYLDDIGAFSKTWEYLIQILDKNSAVEKPMVSWSTRSSVNRV